MEKKRINSRTKGKVGELEIVNILKSYGIEARRGQQFKGTNDSPDVIHNLEPFEIEVKRVQNLNLHKAMNKTIETMEESKIATVWHRKNGTEWLVTMRMTDLLERVLNKVKLEEDF